MYLKNYQKRVVEVLNSFFETSYQTKEDVEKLRILALENNLETDSLNWVESTFKKLKIHYNDKSENGLKEFIPEFA